MANTSNKWTQKLEALEIAPSMVIDAKDKLTVSSTMSRLLSQGKKEFVLKQSKISGEVIVVRIK